MNLMIEIAGTIGLVFAVTGVVLNNRKLRICFVFFLLSNSLSLFVHSQSHIWSLLVRDGVFIILAIEGWFKWRKRK